MSATYKYYKNSNTAQLIMKQSFEDCSIKNVPDYYYDHNKKPIDIPNLIGFVEIKESKFVKESKKWKIKN